MLPEKLAVAVGTDMQQALPSCYCLLFEHSCFGFALWYLSYMSINMACCNGFPLISHMVLQVVFVPVAGACIYNRCMHL